MRYFSTTISVVLALLVVSAVLVSSSNADWVFYNRRSLGKDGNGLFDARIGAYDTATGTDVTPAGFSTSYSKAVPVEGLAYRDGYLYVSGGFTDPTGGEIQIYDALTGAHVDSYTASTSEFARGLAFDSAGNLYCGLKTTGKIVKITPGGSVSDWSTGGTGPYDMQVYGNTLYVGSGDGLWALDLASGDAKVLDGTEGYIVAGIAFTPADTLYTTDNGGQGSVLRRWEVDQFGTYSVVETFSPGNNPKDVDYINGDLYVNTDDDDVGTYILKKFDISTSEFTEVVSVTDASWRPGYVVSAPIPGESKRGRS